MSLRTRSLWLVSAPWLLASAFVACGGLNNGEVIVVPDTGSGDDDDTPTAGKNGSGGSESSGGTENAAGSGNNSGTGNAPGFGGEGDGGEPPIVISDDPPAVVSISPDDLSVDVDPITKVTIEFTESVDPATLTDAIVVKDGTHVIPTTIDVAGVNVQLKFPARLDLLAKYTVTVSKGVKDLAGTALTAAFSSSFQVRDGTWGHFVQVSNRTGSISSQSYPSPVFDAQGNGLVVWSQAGATSAQEIWARFYNPVKGWSAAAKISVATTGCSYPALAMNAAGDAVVAWGQTEAPNIRVYARRYLKGAWEAKPLRVDTFDITQLNRVVVGMSETGDAHLLWRYFKTYQYLHGVHTNGAAAWPTSDSYITGSFDDASGPTLSFGADGNGFMAMSTTSGTTSSVTVRRYLTSTGKWATSDTITGSATVSVSEDAPPTVAADAKGGAMVAWLRPNDVATSRFTKAGGWSAVAPADAGATSVSTWAPRLANDGDDFMVFWHQQVGNIRNAFANRYTGTAWAAQPALLSNGNTSVQEWADTGFGLDRHGNGVAIWPQGEDMRFARYLAESKEWQADGLIETVAKTGNNPVGEGLLGVSSNGMAAAMYCRAYPYHQTHDAIWAGVFE